MCVLIGHIGQVKKTNRCDPKTHDAQQPLNSNHQFSFDFVACYRLVVVLKGCTVVLFLPSKCPLVYTTLELPVVPPSCANANIKGLEVSVVPGGVPLVGNSL